MPKVIKSFRLSEDVIQKIQTMRRREVLWSSRIESEADVIERLVREAYGERNAKSSLGT